MPIKPIRNSAKAIIIKDNKVLLTKNKDKKGTYFLLPGGGQHHKETLDEAVVRECKEETGATISVEKLLFVREYIVSNHGAGELDPNLHQVEFIFKCNIQSEPETNLQSEPDAFQTGVEWIPLQNLSNIRLLPFILKEILPKKDFEHSSPVYLGEIL